MVTFEPVLAENGQTYSQLITLSNGTRILIDLGWDAALQLDLAPLAETLARVDLVLLTHATINHLGALSILYKRVPELAKTPIYSTYPVMTLGKLVTIEAYRSAGIAGPFADPEMTVEEIEASFNDLELIKYSQPINMARHGLEDLQITGYNSGHSLGGTLWKLKTPLDSVLVALDWNHSKDTHLNGGFLATGGRVNEQLLKPQLLLTSSNLSRTTLKKSKTELAENIEKILRNNGTVLLPTSLARSLELILILDSLNLRVPMLFVSPIAKKALEQASSMLEWMVTSIINDWQVKNESPFETSNFTCVSTFEALDNYRDEAKVIVCTDECLELGIGRQIFAEVANSSKNAILLTQPASPHNTLAGALLKLWSRGGLAPLSGDLLLKLAREEPLRGQELEKYQEKIRELEKQADLEAALEKKNQAILEQVEAEESSDEEEMQLDPEGEAAAAAAGGILTGPGATGPNILYYGQYFDYSIPPPSAMGANLFQFPYLPHRQKTDDYGELLKSGQFQKVEGEMDIEMELLETEAPTLAKKEVFKIREKPMKIVTKEETVRMNCLVNHLDLDGLTDIRSLTMIFGQVNPQSVIVLPGNSTEAVQKVCEGSLVGDIKIEIESKESVMELKLTKKLQDGLKWQHILGDYRVVHATGIIGRDPEGSRLLEMAPEHKAQAGTLFVGEIKLTELKKKLSKEGYLVEFKGPGVLVCNDKISVRKQGENNFVIEGGLEEEFYVVRQAIRSFLAQI